VPDDCPCLVIDGVLVFACDEHAPNHERRERTRAALADGLRNAPGAAARKAKFGRRWKGKRICKNDPA
jgi:hypothetical protein